MDRNIKNVLDKAFELNKLIGDGTSLWETGFIGSYALFAKRQNDDLSLSFCVEQGRELLAEMFERKLVEDRSDILKGIVAARYASGDSEDDSEEESGKRRTLYQYVDHLLGNAQHDGKQDGNNVISMACGMTGNDELQYEIRVVLEPRKNKWFGSSGEVHYLNTGEE